jgi:hypothetical protein
MQVVTYELLVQEEKNRQVAKAIFTGLAAASNAYSASQAGYGHYTTLPILASSLPSALVSDDRDVHGFASHPDAVGVSLFDCFV